ncbi:Protein max [Trichoplax sp. H2]|uniref:Protein max n=1 Tax=Trichoplax adhaerens TaxID=10228 RepID=B3RKW8_TRIAD|nr:hypothetical protein TRIADDRAFT_51792 [Trichoplax adhaerens]EDV28659.1 hypothetical protein TRIADDRAFT_51792 [Trichoplax adhaerens]RDD38502.1 Protein max [Trichoplax sp. H2]|eukprot:XP_002107861.1 hypothetical protein TRIADDRAFT_51792 [Trichoplax adhaerens]
MSDEDKYLDVDIDSDDNGDTDKSTSGLTQADKRAHHNALERKRRDHIKDCFFGLRDSVPTLQGEKASRAQILNKATDYIQFMKQKNQNHQSDIEDIRKENYQLELQLKTLERTRNNLTGTATSENIDSSTTTTTNSGRTTRNKAKRELQSDGNDEQKTDTKKVKAE